MAVMVKGLPVNSMSVSVVSIWVQTITTGSSTDYCLNGGEISCSSENVSVLPHACVSRADWCSRRSAWLSHSVAQLRKLNVKSAQPVSGMHLQSTSTLYSLRSSLILGMMSYIAMSERVVSVLASIV